MLLAAIGQYFFGITIFVLSIFLVLLVLVQRGRGGGLTGALGGPGGQSAFGTKAGDLFTRITVVVAAVWIFTCASAVFFLKAPTLTGITGDTIVGDSSTDDGAASIGGTPADVDTRAAGAAEDAEANAGDFVEPETDAGEPDEANEGDGAAAGDEAEAPAGDQ